MAQTDETYDGIIIGAGHHGLILGAYLAKAGLRVAVLERRSEYGGGLSTEEVTLPGFRHNLHSTNHFSVTSTPWYRDLNLTPTVRYLTPTYEFAQPHLDGSALVFSRDIEETVASIARFSHADATTFREWNQRAEEMTREIFLKERFSEPLSEERRAELLDRSPIGREFLSLTERQPGEVVEELFENERVKVLFMFKLSLFGTVLHETLGTRSPMGSLIRAFDLTAGYQLCVGGSRNLADGLMWAFRQGGGTYIDNADVEQVEVDGGRATGVVLADGRSLRARQFVASTVDVHQTFNRFVPRDALPAEFAQKVDDFRYTNWALYGLHLALRESPRYTSAAFDPHVNEAMKYNIGSESIASLNKAHAEVEAGLIPTETQFGAGALTALDPSQAPAAQHTAYAWHVVPFAPGGDPAKLEAAKDEMRERILERWRRYAPNLTDDNILGSYVHTPLAYSKDIVNMYRGDIMMGAVDGGQVMYNHFGYRTPIDGLYMAGSSGHPNGGITGGAGYIVAGVIARDLDIKPWWTPMDAEAALSKLPSAVN
jgi:phytoene dehydrogenase-like protein